MSGTEADASLAPLHEAMKEAGMTGSDAPVADAAPPSPDPTHADKPTPDAAAPAKETAKQEQAPDLSGFSEEEREQVSGLPVEAQRVLIGRWRKLQGTFTRNNQKATTDIADAESYRRLMKDPAEAQAWMEFRKERLLGKKPEKKAPKQVPLTDEEYDGSTREIARDETADLRAEVAELRAMLVEPVKQRNAVDKALMDASQDYEPAEFDAAVNFLADDAKARRVNPYDGITPESASRVLALAVQLSKVQSAKPATPPPVAARATAIKGAGTGAPVKQVPAWEREKRQPTSSEQFDQAWNETLGEMGLSQGDVRNLAQGGAVIIQRA